MRKTARFLTLALLLAFFVPNLGQNSPSTACKSTYVDLRNIVQAMGWTVTSEMGGGHNAHSKHYLGKAIDIRSRGRTEFDIAVLYSVLEPMGYKIRDERKRPKGQRVWRGPHFHIEVPYCD